MTVLEVDPEAVELADATATMRTAGLGVACLGAVDMFGAPMQQVTPS